MTNIEHMRSLTGCDLFVDTTARYLMRYGVCPPGRWLKGPVGKCHPTYNCLVCWEEWLNKECEELKSNDQP